VNEKRCDIKYVILETKIRLTLSPIPHSLKTQKWEHLIYSYLLVVSFA
jgi:hypothetical protein